MHFERFFVIDEGGVRGRGLGALLTRRVLGEAMARGAHAVHFADHDG